MYLDSKEPAFLGFRIMISVFKSLKKVGSLGSRAKLRIEIWSWGFRVFRFRVCV